MIPGAAQFVRFVAVGGLSNVVYVLLFLLAAGAGTIAANIIGVAASTGVANELHRRLTFRAADRVGWLTAQVEGGGLAVLGLVISSAVLAGFELWLPDTGDVTRAATVVAVSAAVGVARFVALRGWVFAPGRTARVGAPPQVR